MNRRYYSKRHFDRVSNRGAGNPAATKAEKIATWEALKKQFPNDPRVQETLDNLIAEESVT